MLSPTVSGDAVTNAIDAYVGCRLRLRRIQRQMLPAALAARIGRTAADVEAWENGARIPADTLFEILKALDIRMADLFPPANSSASAEDLTPAQRLVPARECLEAALIYLTAAGENKACEIVILALEEIRPAVPSV
jgi:transcriptional regulator with XRE-family HTH domain